MQREPVFLSQSTHFVGMIHKKACDMSLGFFKRNFSSCINLKEVNLVKISVKFCNACFFFANLETLNSSIK